MRSPAEGVVFSTSTTATSCRFCTPHTLLSPHSSFALRRPSSSQCLFALCKSHASVLFCILSNALHVLYFSHYIHSLGPIRFNKTQEFFMYFFSVYYTPVNYTDLYVFAIQLCFRALDANTVYDTCLAFFIQGLKEEIEDDNEDAPKGKETMLTYFFFCLLSAVYDRNIISYDSDVVLTRRVINYACRMENQTLREIEESMQNFQPQDELVFKILQRIADEEYDMDKAENVYRLKKETVQQASIFNGYGSLFDQNEMLEVCVLARSEE